MTNDPVPPIIRVPVARWETSQELNRALPLTDPADWTWDDSIAQLEMAKTRLLEACAAGELRMIVCDPATGSRHDLPIKYFHTDEARIDFEKEVFHGYVLTDRVAQDPEYLLVKHLIGWPHVFLEAEFRKWLKDPEIGPQAGPRLPRYWTVQEGIEGISDKLSCASKPIAVDRPTSSGALALEALPAPSAPENSAAVPIHTKSDHGAVTAAPELPSHQVAEPLLADANNSAFDQGTPGLTPRKQRTLNKRKMYEIWRDIAKEHGLNTDGTARAPTEIARKVAQDPRARDPVSERQPAYSSVIRRLNKLHLGWAQKT